MIDNPLLQAWDTPFGLPPFERFRAAHFEPAMRQAMRVHREELAAIATQAGPPDFDNTCAALDRAGRLLDRVSAAFYTLTASATTAELQAVQREMAAPLAAHVSAVLQDEALFARLDALHARRDELALDGQQRRLLERQHLDFVRAGACLAPAARRRQAEIEQALAGLTTRFAQNVLHDETEGLVRLEGEPELAGLPAPLRSAMAQAAAERGLAGHAVPLSRPFVMAVLTASTRRDLRERLWRAWTDRGAHAGAHGNAEVVREILRLRHELATLHGHASFADHALVDTMAGHRAAVTGLLDEVWVRALQAVQREQQELLEEMATQGVQHTLQPWDWPFWAEQVRRRRYDLNDDELKPYFALDKMVEAAFDCAGRLFGLRLRRRDDLPVYHPDVRAYEVSDDAGRTLGVFLQDSFARPGKRSGAWMGSLRAQCRNTADGEAQLPLIVNNSNFARGGGAHGEPTLLSVDDLRTLFHEFGHALHGLLSDVRYERLSGTQVLRDFVELPSQLFEHWATEPQVLQRHARHWRSGEPMPPSLLQRLEQAQRFNQGWQTVRYTASALLDLAVHADLEGEAPADLLAFEQAFLRERGLPDAVGVNHRLLHFQHLFGGGGYAARYYVYLWAEVLDADGHEAFVEAGDPFDAALAARLKRFIYGSGNSLDPQAAYAAFRGRAPTVQPLLRKRGLLTAAATA